MGGMMTREQAKSLDPKGRRRNVKTENDWRREASPLITLGYIDLFHLLKLTAHDPKGEE